MRFLLLSLLGSSVVTLTACGDKTTEICDDGIDNDENGSLDCADEACGGDAMCADADADGFLAKDDCDDNDASSYPDADEVCDEVDNNCDGAVDENPTDGEHFYLDDDGDGFGYFENLVVACELADGLSDNPDDCDDEDADIHPDADEICDEIDNNCDNVTDSDAIDRNTYYRDIDEDGYGDDEAIQEACSLPEGFAEEGGDCDNQEPLANPGATEVCDGIDNNCDGDIDINATDGVAYYADADEDGYGDASVELVGCEQPEGYVTDDTDCDDTNAEANPGASEVCDEGVDNDCNGLADDDDSNLIEASSINWYLDADGDGYGEEGSTASESCTAPIDSTTGNTYVDNDDDCDDTSITIYLGAPEVCDTFDNDCDGVVNDKPTDAVQYYLDADEDGYGDDNNIIVDCSDPSTSTLTYVTQGGDCDDSDSSFNPGVTDTCDGIDQNCSGDESDASGSNTFYIDLDNDGYGSTVSSLLACEAPANFVSDGTDCDDADPNVNPDADEVCDAIDNDCDGDIDQADSGFDSSNLITYYEDADSDGFGNELVSVEDCSAPTGYVTDGTDCDDDANDADGDGVADGFAFNPNAAETYYDGVDANCDGWSDYDQDQDGEDAAAYVGACSDTSYTNQADCEGAGACSDIQYTDQTSCENNSETWTSAEETWNATGTDCDDTSASLNSVDADGDGYSTCADDCNDSALDTDGDGVADGFYTYPGAAENEADPTLCLTDMDNDGYGGAGTFGCYEFQTHDTYGDGWNNNSLEIYEDGILTASITNENLDGSVGSTVGGEYHDITHCFDGNTQDIEIYFNDGSFNSEVSFEMYDSSGTLLGSGQGSGSYDLIFDGVTYTDGDLIYSETVLSGMDCDDSDASIGSIDEDGDGALDCTVDCDPTDPALNTDDLDGDGYSTCSEDCDDNDASVHPNAVDTWYDGLDSNCDGADDFDQDGDGEQDASAGYCDDAAYTNQTDCENAGECDDVSYLTEIDCLNNGVCSDTQYANEIDCVSASETWTDNTWTAYSYSWTLVNGTDCNDTDPNIYSTAPEVCNGGVDDDCDGLLDDADPSMLEEDMNAYYEDHDGDGFGVDSTETFACTFPVGSGFGYVDQGGDCNDDLNNNGAAQNPGVTEIYYDGADGDCSGDSDYDSDGDGYDSRVYSGSCSDTQYTNQIDCEGVGTCSDPLYNTQTDCENNGATWTSAGNSWTPLGTDCDDEDASAAPEDLDGDGWTSCDGDCDDSDLDEDGDGVADGFYTHPGAAENEADPNVCATDADEDGWAESSPVGCYDFVMNDSYGDGWNGNELSVYEDGLLTGVITLGSSLSYGEETFCFDESTQDIEIQFTSGSWTYEISFEMYNDSGSLIGTGQGDSSFNLTFDGAVYSSGDVFYTTNASSGNDCDDTDPNIGPQDDDGDGVSACTTDCDDNDPLNAGTFAEDCTDGQDNDCDGLADCDDSDCEASCFELDCADGQDGDGDGDVDCDDSDCADDFACIEVICDDGFDDDGDGDIDCDDSDCAEDVTCEFACVAGMDLGVATGTAVATGTNLGEGDDSDGSCSTSTGGEDVSYRWTSPATGTYTFSTVGSTYDTILYIDESCVGAELDCNDDADFNAGVTSSEILDVFVTSGESIVVTIDAYEYFESGTYSLDITPTFEQTCDDGIDDDGDGVSDCADDDCTFDAACASLICPNYDLGTSTGTVMTGDLSGALDDSFEPSCASSFWSYTGNDYLVTWEAPESGCATFETLGSSTTPMIALFDDCPDNGGVEEACSEATPLEFDVTAGDMLYIGLDTYTYAASYNYSLDITIEPNVSCN